MVMTFPRNGATERPGAFPRTPLLLAPVILPFQGPGYSDAGPITILYSVPAVRDLVAEIQATQGHITAIMGFSDKEAAIVADESLTDAEKQARVDDLVLDGAHQIIGQVVYGVEWPYTDPPPDPRRPESFDLWDRRVVVWIAYEGLLLAGAQYTGPLARAMRGRY
jgi:hypothetical protein